MSNIMRGQVEVFRRRAGDIRGSAETAPVQMRQALLQLADGYDRLADSLDKMVRRADDRVAPWRLLSSVVDENPLGEKPRKEGSPSPLIGTRL